MIETPCVIIDERKMDQNIRKMARIAQKNGVRLRPHVKTHKIPAIARKQLAEGAAGITVAKVSEAEVMANHGIHDIFIAYPLVVESKIERAIALSKNIDLIVGVDSIEGAKKCSELAKKHQHTLSVRLEVDTGLKRTGVKYEQAVALAKEINQLDNLQLRGIYTFRGAIFQGKPTLDLEKAGLEEGKLMVSLANAMRQAGIGIQDVSVGSTPTAEYAARVEGITEIRPGTYVFYDKMQVNLGACSLDECAATVLVSVVSKPSENLLIIDGGSKTFATDIQPHTDPTRLNGFGHITNLPEAVLDRMTEEHGMITLRGGGDIRIGDTLEVIPNHICSTVNLHNHVYIKSAQGLTRVTVAGRGKLD
ncbi:alanine racemase [Lihuaxuella thermophila]|uniref:D-serine deaminase, pyridoxal phosphate-dependent n=1 Tax=Lihuaxuella thermophila TaxID=1173111 RepID=A0A1H8ADM5_9BACL|nr:alanine racemase [Lihuaxuella thermophila]SEM68865.1 D-serine deaminase, pyridoxal phosphate-dependent [Lihuaxuella thermophila]